MAEEQKPAASPAGTAATGAAASADRKAKKKNKKNIQTGIVYIQSTFNNTIITITDVSGNVLSWSSAGARGFKGSRKSTPFAAQVAAGDAAAKAMEHGLKNVSVLVKGPGAGRESALRYIGEALDARGVIDPVARRNWTQRYLTLQQPRLGDVGRRPVGLLTGVDADDARCLRGGSPARHLNECL